MGLDSVELIMATEESFGIHIEDAEACNIGTVAQLENLVLAKLLQHEPDSLTHNAQCLSNFAFYRLRAAMLRHTNLRRLQIRPRASLEELIPMEKRRLLWQHISRDLGWKLPTLRRSANTQRGLAVLFVLTSCGMVTMIDAPCHFWLGLFGAGGITWLGYKLSESLAKHFPADLVNVGTLVNQTVRHNLQHIETERKVWDKEQQAWRTEEIRVLVRQVISEQLGIPLKDILPTHHLVHDLGMDQ